MLNVLKNLVNSEKAVVVGALIIAATVLAALDKLSIVQWLEYTQVLAGIYVGGKAIQGAAAQIAKGKSAEAATDAANIQTMITEMRAAIEANDATADAALAAKFAKE